MRAQPDPELDQPGTGLTKAAACCHGGQCGEVRPKGWSAAGGKTRKFEAESIISRTQTDLWLRPSLTCEEWNLETVAKVKIRGSCEPAVRGLYLSWPCWWFLGLIIEGNLKPEWLGNSWADRYEERRRELCRRKSTKGESVPSGSEICNDPVFGLSCAKISW